MHINNLLLPDSLIKLIEKELWKVPQNINYNKWLVLLDNSFDIEDVRFNNYEEMFRDTNDLNFSLAISNQIKYIEYKNRKEISPIKIRQNELVVIGDLYGRIGRLGVPICLYYKFLNSNPLIISMPDDHIDGYYWQIISPNFNTFARELELI